VSRAHPIQEAAIPPAVGGCASPAFSLARTCKHVEADVAIRRRGDELISLSLRFSARRLSGANDAASLSPYTELSASLNCAPRKDQNASPDEPSNEIAQPPTERDAKDS
jgi:hypothetical protein